MRYVADLFLAAAIATCCTVMAFAPLACIEQPPSTDAGADPDISACCDWFYMPWLDRPQACLRDHTDPGECRWLTCLGGLVEYEVCK